MNDLQATLDQWKADATALRRNGQVALADVLDRCAREARESAEEWLTWLSEPNAAMRSGFGIKWFRARREVWRRDGHARAVGRGQWEYRAAIVPRRANLVSAAAQGRAAARRAQGIAA